MLYKNSSCKCDSLLCKNCESLEKKVHYLVKLWISFQRVNPTLRMSLHLKIVFLEKHDWVLIHRANRTSFQTLFLHERSKQPVVTCFYCMKKCHSVRFCKIRKYFVPKGIMRWIPKDSGVPSDECKSKGPTFVRGPNLCT